jgi:DNA-binding NarL/FixJ family response regulator
MQAVIIAANDDNQHLEPLHNAELLLIEAIAAARESISRCEQALYVLSLVRSQVTLILEPIHITSQQSYHPVGDLTCREVEVLRLIAAGHSNRQIADALFISPRTIERHIANIYLKIDAHSKTEATAYALRHRLV